MRVLSLRGYGLILNHITSNLVFLSLFFLKMLLHPIIPKKWECFPFWKL